MTVQTSLWREQAPLVLASRSVARRNVLTALGISFEVIPADIDERRLEAKLREHSATPAEVARALAREKARAVSRANPDRLVLAADQVLALADMILAKPENREGAARQLALLSGRTHVLHSALALYRGEAQLFETEAAARMSMRQLSPDFIVRYLDASGETIWASVGAYQIEGLGPHLFADIQGDHWTILGLPALPLLAFLREQGKIAA